MFRKEQIEEANAKSIIDYALHQGLTIKPEKIIKLKKLPAVFILILIKTAGIGGERKKVAVPFNL